MNQEIFLAAGLAWLAWIAVNQKQRLTWINENQFSTNTGRDIFNGYTGSQNVIHITKDCTHYGTCRDELWNLDF